MQWLHLAMTVRRPSLHQILTATVLALAVALRVADPNPVARLRLSIFDNYLTLKPRQIDPNYPVRIVDIDEASLERIGQWPWPRSELARLVDRLAEAGAKSVSIDLILSEPDRLSPEALARQAKVRGELAPIISELAALPSNDDLLAKAMVKLPVVLGLAADNRVTKPLRPSKAHFAIAGDDPRLFVPRFPGATQSLSVLAASAAGEGAVNWLPAADQVVRHVPLLVTLAGELHPSLSLEALRTGLGQSTVFVRASGGSGVSAFGQETGIDTVRVGETVLPTSGDGQLWLNFAPPDRKRYIPAYTILDGTFDPREVAGRTILIGASATGLLDLRATPLSPAVPGVEIHAEAIEQMLSGEHLVRPALATGAELVFLVAAGALVAALIRRAGPLVAAAIGITAITVVSLGSWLAFSTAGYLFDPVYPSLSLLAVYLTGSLLAFVKTETDRARVKSAFGHYLAAPLVEELAADPSRLKLGGETREVTLLFADVRGFSRLSEGMDAETLIRFVNRLFTPLSDVILENRGTIDKFMGDAVMAFWNAPLADADHAANACRAALEMQARIAEINRTEAVLRAAAGERASTIRIGIGLNTGPCCVGNVGSPQRFDYSVLGDPVNVASRLEETTKIYGAPIIAGERTAAAARGFAFLEVDTQATLRGKDRPERLFALIGDESVTAAPAFGELVHLFTALKDGIANGDAKAAEAALIRCRALGAALDAIPISGLLDSYARRLKVV
jgi:adenylate cyclase